MPALTVLARPHAPAILPWRTARNPFFVSTSSGESTNRSPQPPAEHLQGIIERVTYHAEDSGYTVARLKAPGERDLRTSRSAPHRRPASKLIHCGLCDEQGKLHVHQLCALLPQLSLERLIIGDCS
jgi:hypothetical protein